MFLLLDIGGTNTRMAISKDLREIQEGPEVFKTPDNFEEGIEKIKEISQKILRGEDPRMVCAGIAGPLSRDSAKLVNSPNKNEWVEQPLKSELEEKLFAPVLLENDTALAGLGEWARGAGQNSEIMAYITVSTGVGGSRIVKGEIDNRIYSFEPGHQIIDIDSTLNLYEKVQPSAGKRKADLEDTVSGSALEARAGKKPYEIQDEGVWDKVAEVFAGGLCNTVVHWSPETVVLGGSMITGSPGISVERVAHYLKENLYIYPEPPELKKAELGDYGGLYGAMEFIKQNIFE